MNAKGRKELQGLIEKLDEVKTDLEFMQEDEQSKLDNMPEGIQESERGEMMQNGIDQLEYAIDNLDECIGNLQEIIE